MWMPRAPTFPQASSTVQAGSCRRADPQRAVLCRERGHHRGQCRLYGREVYRLAGGDLPDPDHDQRQRDGIQLEHVPGKDGRRRRCAQRDQWGAWFVKQQYKSTESTLYFNAKCGNFTNHTLDRWLQKNRFRNNIQRDFSSGSECGE